MRTTSSNFDTENAKSNKKPVIQIAFNGVTNSFSTGTFSSIAATVKKFITSFKMRISRINLLQGSQELSSMSFTVTDKDQEITTILDTDPLVDNTITVSYGFQEISSGDFMSLPTQKTSKDITLQSDLRSYQFVTEDARRLLVGDIARQVPETNITQDIPTGVISGGSFTVEDNSAFLAGGGSVPGWWPGDEEFQFVKVNNEIMSYGDLPSSTTIDDNGSTGIHRNLCGTNQAAHSDGDPCTQVYAFRGQYPTEALLTLLLTTDDASGHAYYDLSNFDANYVGFGYGFASADVDITSIEQLGYKIFNLWYENCEGMILCERQNGLNWITNNILKPGGLVLYINGDGQISLTSIDRLHLVETFSSVRTLTTDDFKLLSYTVNYKDLVNFLNLQYRPRPTSNSWRTSIEVELDDSVIVYGKREKPHVVQSPFFPIQPKNFDVPFTLNGAPNGAEWNSVIPYRWLYAFGEPTGRIRFQSTLENIDLEVLDEIALTNSDIPDTNSGSLGWTTKPFIITSQEFTFPDKNIYEAITFEAYTQLGPYYTFTTIENAAIDDTDVAFNSNRTATTNTEDGFYDFTGLESGAPYRFFIIDIIITPSGNGTTNHNLDLTIFLMDSFATLEPAVGHYRGIHYVSGPSTTPFTLQFFIATTVTFGATSDRIKVDWYDGSSDGLEGGGSERPSSITFNRIQCSDFEEAIS